jgi:predicted ArsR family transcriptional regulator
MKVRRIQSAQVGTQDRIAHMLRRSPTSADELATAMGMTANAVRQHLATLERDGIVIRRGPRRLGTVGKPATIYEITPEAETAFSRAYAPVLTALVAALQTEVSTERLSRLLEDVGMRLAAEVPPARGDLADRARAGAAQLDALGGITEVIDKDDGRVIIRGCSCPLSDAVIARPELCKAIERMLGAVTGAEVHEHCDRGGRPRCEFVLTEHQTP